MSGARAASNRLLSFSYLFSSFSYYVSYSVYSGTPHVLHRRLTSHISHDSMSTGVHDMWDVKAYVRGLSSEAPVGDGVALVRPVWN